MDVGDERDWVTLTFVSSLIAFENSFQRYSDCF